jgi:hypothetical protein
MIWPQKQLEPTPITTEKQEALLKGNKCILQISEKAREMASRRFNAWLFSCHARLDGACKIRVKGFSAAWFEESILRPK